jgi:hypothetical protein
MVARRNRIPLSKTHPELLTQWHPTLNGELTPEQVVAGSSKKVWWICTNGPDHEWLGILANRSRGAGCPFCAGRYMSVTNSLATLLPQIASEWHPTNNGVLNPDQVVARSNQKAWWKCPQGPDHEWQAALDARARSGCPFCSGCRASVTNSLSTLHPKLASQWHPTKNGDLTPEQFASGSRTRVWWKCQEGPDHEWQGVIGSRTQTRGETGCPFCAGQRLSVTNSLASVSPQIASQWHSSKNGDLSPDMVVAGSTRKVWWKCQEGPDHEWETKLVGRTHVGNGCPFCRGLKVSVTNSLEALHPELAAQWHPIKNGSLTPDQVSFGSDKQAWWVCPEGPDHEWRAKVQERTRGQGCSFCAGKRVSVTNALTSLFPGVATQWHPTKNGAITPDNFTGASQKKVWWQCPNDGEHEWQATVANRTYSESGCPYCNLRPRSIQEIDMVFELKEFFDIDLDDRKLVEGGKVFDCDIIIRQERLIVEFDGSYWHSGARMYKRDLDKTKALQKAGWKVIRVREEPLRATSSTDVSVPLRQDMKLTVNAVLLKIEKILGGHLTGIEHYLNTQHLQNSVASKKFARHLMRNKATQQNG